MFPLLALVIDATEVLMLRVEKIASGGPEAVDELRLIHVENLTLVFNTGATILSGSDPFDVFDRMRENVALNRVRLRRSTIRIVK